MKKVFLTAVIAVAVIVLTVFLAPYLPAQNNDTNPNPSPIPDGWMTVSLLDASPASASLALPSDAKNVKEGMNRWTLADAYLEKSRTMKTTHLDASSARNPSGCFVSTDLESVISETETTLDGVPFCVETGLSVGAGQVYRTLMYASKDAAVPLAISFTIHYPNSVQVYAGCETEADLTKPECVARQFHDDDMKLFTNIIATFKAVK